MKRHSAVSSVLKISLLLVLTAISILVSGCDYGPVKPEALEGDSRLYVIAGSYHLAMIKPLLEQSLEREVLTPQPEKRFYLTWGNEDSLKRAARWQNIILAGALDGDDAISQKIQNMLSAEALSGVASGDYGIFKRKDAWAKKQTVVFLIAPSTQALITWIQNHQEDIYNIISEDRNERMKKEIYSVYEQKDLADSLKNVHGWYFRIQHDYKIVNSNDSLDFVRLRRFYPDRFLTIAWKEAEDTLLTAEKLINMRNEIARGFADPQIVTPIHFSAETIDLNGYQALKLNGLWETSSSLGGGPFVAYLVHHKNMMYLLDGQVFAPDRSKEMFIRQFEVILETFNPDPGSDS